MVEDKMSNIKWFAVHLQQAMDECGMRCLSHKLGRQPYDIRRIMRSERVALRTVDKIAPKLGMTVAEMFIQPGVETDWYREARIEYFPQNFTEAMAASGYNTQALANSVGKTKSCVREWMDGKGYPLLIRLQNIADTLDMEVADLFLPPEGDEE